MRLGRTRLEPLVEIDLKKANQTRQETNEDTSADSSRRKGGWENGTHDVGMIETLKHPHLTPHPLLIPLDFLLWRCLQ